MQPDVLYDLVLRALFENGDDAASELRRESEAARVASEDDEEDDEDGQASDGCGGPCPSWGWCYS